MRDLGYNRVLHAELEDCVIDIDTIDGKSKPEEHEEDRKFVIF